MDGFLVAFAVSFGVVFVAELGDKSQLMALTFATRYRAVPVLVGITLAAAVTHLVSVAVGYGLGASLPTGWITLVAALVFLGFGLWSLRPAAHDDGGGPDARPGRGSAVVTVSVAFFLAELGDKTMLATIALGARYDWVGVWLGSTAGMVAVGALAIVVGRTLGRRLPERVVAVGGAVLFLVFGTVMLVEAVPQVGGPGARAALGAALDHHVVGWVAAGSGLLALLVGTLVRRRARRARGGRTLRVSRAPGSPAWWARVLFGVAAVLGLGAPVLVALDVVEPIAPVSGPGVAVVGAGLALLGFAVAAVSLLQLGTVWRRTATEAGHAAAGDPEAARRPVLATGGLHRRVRNPALTGLIVGCAGVLLMAPTPAGLLAGVLILVAVQIQARRVYEAGLGEALGGEYDRYRMRTGRFLPRVRPPEPRPGMPAGRGDRARVG